MKLAKRPSFDELPDVVAPKEVAAYLGLDLNFTYRLLKAGVIRNVRVGRRFLVPKRALVEFLDKEEEAKK